jgi:hypothetical protein
MQGNIDNRPLRSTKADKGRDGLVSLDCRHCSPKTSLPLRVKIHISQRRATIANIGDFLATAMTLFCCVGGLERSRSSVFNSELCLNETRIHYHWDRGNTKTDLLMLISWLDYK